MSEEKKMIIDKELISYIEWNRNIHAKSRINETSIKATAVEGTLLHYAAAFGNTVIARHLIELGSEVDALGRNNVTPLKLAVLTGREEIVKILFEANANVDIVDTNGKSALELALSWHELFSYEIFKLFSSKVTSESRDSVDLAKRLIAAGCNMHHAAVLGDFELAKCMLKLEVHVDSTCSRNRSTALHVAARYNDLDLVGWLIAHGANVNARDKYRSSALLIAASRGHRDAMKILLEHGADPNCREIVKDRTPLFALFVESVCDEKLFVQCLELLLQHGAIPRNPVRGMHTLLDVVAFHSSEEGREMFIGHLAILAALKNGTTEFTTYSNIDRHLAKIRKLIKFHKRCSKALKIEVLPNLSMLDLIRADERRMRLLARNKTFASEVIKICNEHNLRESHGYYYTLLMDCIAKACRLVKLEDYAIRVIAKMFNGNYNQCHTFARKVNTYLSERDLHNLMQLL